MIIPEPLTEQETLALMIVERKNELTRLHIDERLTSREVLAGGNTEMQRALGALQAQIRTKEKVLSLLEVLHSESVQKEPAAV